MASYMLLRSNKKSGPYSLQDLVSFGLKAYDLVWVDGKSAAWRYPSEVEELRPYAPQVEEQPYDRFYKKKPTEIQQEPVLAEEKSVVVQQVPQLVKEAPVVVMEKKVVVEDKPVIEEKPVVPVVEQKPLVEQPSFIEEKYEKYIPKKSVAVTMPVYKSVAVQKPVEYTPPPTPTPVVPAPTITVKENPEAQIKYSQPLDEIKEMYVKTLQERKTKIARKSVVVTNLKRAAVIAGLVALGVVTGLIINRGSGSKNTLAQQTNQRSVVPSAAIGNEPVAANVATDQQTLKDGNTSPIDQSSSAINNQADPITQEKVLPSQIEERLLRLEKEQGLQQPSIRNESVTKSPVVKEVYEDRPVETDARTGERSRAVRNNNDVPEEKPLGKAVLKPKKGGSGLESMVSISSNDYKRVAFGGIRNLELTVANDSRYILDKVTVELSYLKPSEEPLKTEMIQFHNVSPNGSMTMKIRDTNRGIKVSYKIVDIQTGQTETALSGF